MGSKSSSSSNQATNNYSTSIGVEGDNNGYITTGNNNSYNITQTDHGLVDGLIGIWGDMNGNVAEMGAVVGDMANDNARMTENVTSSAFDYARDVNSDSLSFAENSQRGAFDLVGDTMAGALGFGSDALSQNSNLARDSITAQNYLAETAITENSDLARSVTELAENMHGNNTAFANNALITTVGALENANNGMGDLAYFTAQNSSDLARDFASGTADLSALAIQSAADAYKTAGDQSALATKQALQFADNSTRSDGQQLAMDTNKTMIFVVVGVAGVAVLALFMGRK